LLDLDRNRDTVNERLHARLRELFLPQRRGWRRSATAPAPPWASFAAQQVDPHRAACTGSAPWSGSTTRCSVHLDARSAGAAVRGTGAPRGPRRLPDADRGQILAELDRLPPRPATAGAEPDLRHPLEGLKVLDLCLALAGPTCGRLLLEFGADVVKIGAPSAGVSGYLSAASDRSC
jgi:hypothetical protein